MALGNSSQWDMPLGKGSPQVTERERAEEEPAAELMQERPWALQLN